MNCFFEIVDQQKRLTLFPSLTIVKNLQRVASRIFTCAKPELKLRWIKLFSIDYHYIMAPRVIIIVININQ